MDSNDRRRAGTRLDAHRAGIHLPGNAARALRTLGLESAVAERASLILHQRLCDPPGPPADRYDLVIGAARHPNGLTADYPEAHVHHTAEDHMLGS